MKKECFLATMVLLLCFGASNTKAQALVDVETGLVATGYNDVRIPGDQGTRFH
ncbi:MAG: hypothetical protein IPN76_33910 [Saprospiraceae bacterium]|nr:hypothetical protein [Saprospiraceae bacterium]